MFIHRTFVQECNSFTKTCQDNGRQKTTKHGGINTQGTGVNNESL